jgi:xylulose-5-phosphate/fructose-6-phosphate phosphoketolase
VIDRVPGLATRAACTKQALRDKLVEHRRYITLHGEDMPEVRDWTWPY